MGAQAVVEGVVVSCREAGVVEGECGCGVEHRGFFGMIADGKNGNPALKRWGENRESSQERWACLGGGPASLQYSNPWSQAADFCTVRLNGCANSSKTARY